MKHIFLLPFLLLFLLPAAMHAQIASPDTCLVEGYIYGPDLQRAAGEKVYVLKTIAPGFLTTLAKGEFEADSTGWIRLTLFRNSRAWLYGRKVNGLERSGGVELVIPDAATARIETLVPPATLSPAYVVAVPLPPNHGDSIKTAYDKMCDFVPRDSITVDTTGFNQSDRVTRAEDDIAELYHENTTQDLLIADAGKWVQYDHADYWSIAPKGLSDTTTVKITSDGGVEAERIATGSTVYGAADMSGQTDTLNVAWSVDAGDGTYKVSYRDGIFPWSTKLSINPLFGSDLHTNLTVKGPAGVFASDSLLHVEGGTHIEGGLHAEGDATVAGTLRANIFGEATPWGQYRFLPTSGSYDDAEMEIQYGRSDYGPGLWTDAVDAQIYGNGNPTERGGLHLSGARTVDKPIYFRSRTTSATPNLTLSPSGRLHIGPGYQHPANRLEVAGNIKMPKDSTADLGIARIAELVIDSTGYILGDTISYKVVEFYEPSTQTVGDRGGRSGRIVFEFQVPFAVNGAGNTFVFDVVSDTANGVYMSFAEMRARGGYDYPTGLAYTAQNTSYFQRWAPSADFSWAVQNVAIGNYASSRTPQFRVRTWLGENPNGVIPVEMYQGNSSRQTKVRIEVEFYLSDSLNPNDIGTGWSNYFVKLVNM